MSDLEQRLRQQLPALAAKMIEIDAAGSGHPAPGIWPRRAYKRHRRVLLAVAAVLAATAVVGTMLLNQSDNEVTTAPASSTIPRDTYPTTPAQPETEPTATQPDPEPTPTAEPPTLTQPEPATAQPEVSLESPCTSPTVVDQALESLVADCESLWAFYRLQDSKSQFGSGPATAWSRTNPMENWRGVTVSDGRVTDLTLYQIDLTGRITGDPMNNLTGLERLHLVGRPEGTQLSGAIPVWLGDATNLRELLLSHHNLSGPIPPELANLSNLVRLDLSNNQLSGPYRRNSQTSQTSCA